MGSRPVEGYHNVANSTLWYCILQDPEIYFQKKKKYILKRQISFMAELSENVSTGGGMVYFLTQILIESYIDIVDSTLPRGQVAL